jgi:hypothetical protein
VALRGALCGEGLVPHLIAMVREHVYDSTVQVQAFRVVAMLAYKVSFTANLLSK